MTAPDLSPEQVETLTKARCPCGHRPDKHGQTGCRFCHCPWGWYDALTPTVAALIAQAVADLAPTGDQS